MIIAVPVGPAAEYMPPSGFTDVLCVDLGVWPLEGACGSEGPEVESIATGLTNEHAKQEAMG